jgi:hypothetical protein
VVFVLLAVSPCGAQVLLPSNLPSTTCETPGLTSLIVPSGTVTIDTNTDCDLIVVQVRGPQICEKKFEEVHIGNGARLVVSGARAFALVATHAIVIDGTIDISATGSADGPGAVNVGSGSGGGGGFGGSLSCVGGGGAGHATAGAAGGEAATGIPGSAYGSPALVPLRGGSRGGAGSRDSWSTGVSGGGGGGAGQFVSCATLTIGPTGVVEAGGGGGRGGNASLAMEMPGGGGGAGSGGGVLIEAWNVTVSGTVAANGGGGGGGGGGLQCGGGAAPLPGQPGEDGRASSAPAAGGSTSGTNSGGSGASATASAQPGATKGGGGGGAVGRIRINIAPGGTVDLTGAVISPPHTSGPADGGNLLFRDGFEST